MTNVISLLKRQKTRPLKLDGVNVEIKCLSLGALEELQSKVRDLEDNEDPKAQFQPVLQLAVVGLEEVTLDDMRDFLLEDMKAISQAVMNLGK